MADRSPSIMQGQRFQSLTLVNGEVVIKEGDGRFWTFVSDGAGCMYPRFVDEAGYVVPWSAVLGALPLHPRRWNE